MDCPRTTATCDTCSEEWNRGPCDYPNLTLGNPAMCYHDTTNKLYWKHIRESSKHQAILQLQYHRMDALLAAIPQAMADGKTYQKTRSDPAFGQLERIMR